MSIVFKAWRTEDAYKMSKSARSLDRAARPDIRGDFHITNYVFSYVYDVAAGPKFTCGMTGTDSEAALFSALIAS